MRAQEVARTKSGDSRPRPHPILVPAGAAGDPAVEDDRRIGELLAAWQRGDAGALERLIPLVLSELRRVAERYLDREGAGHTLQPTALVNELYLRLTGRRRVSWRNRAHFFGFAAQTMRRILVDHARARQASKRGGRPVKVSLEEIGSLAQPRDVDLVRLDDALRSLAAIDPRQASVVELHFFAGLSFGEIAGVVGVGRATVVRDWAIARAWLFRELWMG